MEEDDFPIDIRGADNHPWQKRHRWQQVNTGSDSLWWQATEIMHCQLEQKRGYKPLGSSEDQQEAEVPEP